MGKHVLQKLAEEQTCTAPKCQLGVTISVSVFKPE